MGELPGQLEEKERSVLRGEGSYFNRILSRDISVGSNSSNDFLYYLHANVPFNWENQPGKSKTPPKEANSTSPIIGPPPVSSELVLKPGPKKIPEPPKTSGWSRIMFWRKSSKKRRNRRKSEVGPTAGHGLYGCLALPTKANRSNHSGLDHGGSSQGYLSLTSLGSSSTNSSSSRNSRLARVPTLKFQFQFQFPSMGRDQKVEQRGI